MKKVLLAIVGMPGAGKTVAADFFRRDGIPVLRFGDQVDIGLREIKLAVNEKNERWYREKLRKDLGMAAMAIKMESRIAKITNDKFIVLDGLYSWEEYLYLIKKFPYLKLLCIYAEPRVRYSRLSKRKVRPLKLSEARSRDFAEISNLNKGGPIAIADFLIINQEGIKELNKKISHLVTELTAE